MYYESDVWLGCFGKFCFHLQIDSDIPRNFLKRFECNCHTNLKTGSTVCALPAMMKCDLECLVFLVLLVFWLSNS